MMNRIISTGKTALHNQCGSGLIGMALLLLGLGFLISGGIFLMKNYQVIHSDQENIDYSLDIESALKDFMAREKRLPCPMKLDEKPGSSDFGQENCTTTTSVTGRAGLSVLIGAVPVRALNLSDKKIVDGYKKRFVYAVTQNLTTGAGDVYNDLGAISLHRKKDNPGDPDVSITDVDGTVTYALMSPGEDNRGAYDINGNLLAPCQNGTDAGENCDFTNGGTNATFVTTAAKSFGQQDSFTSSFAFKANSVPYLWYSGAWSDCSGECNNGTQTRTVECRDNKGNVVPAARESDADRCGHTPKPPTTQACQLAACYWYEGPWSDCVGVCFSGIQTRTVNCRNRFANIASSEALCPVGKPIESRPCTLPPCSWNTGGWGACNGGAPGSSSGGASTGGGGGSVLCGYFFNRGLMSAEIYKGDRLFAELNVGEATKRGYHFWAVPLTSYLNDNPGGLAEKIVQPFVLSWAQEMAFRTGHAEQGHWLGKVQLAVAKPMTYVVGLFVEDTDWKHLKSEQEVQQKLEAEGSQ